MGGMERIKGERIELHSGRAEKQDQNRLNLGRFVSLKKIWAYLQNCACGEDIFTKIGKKVVGE